MSKEKVRHRNEYVALTSYHEYQFLNQFLAELDTLPIESQRRVVAIIEQRIRTPKKKRALIRLPRKFWHSVFKTLPALR